MIEPRLKRIKIRFKPLDKRNSVLNRILRSPGKPTINNPIVKMLYFLKEGFRVLAVLA